MWPLCSPLKHDVFSHEWYNLQAGYRQGERFLLKPQNCDVQASACTAPGKTENSHSCMLQALKPLTLLVTGDEDGALVLSVGGLFPVARLRLSGLAAVAVACCASGDLRSLYVWTQTINGPKLEVYNMEFLITRQHEVPPRLIFRIHHYK